MNGLGFYLSRGIVAGFVLAATLAVSLTASAMGFRPYVIYGTDDRADVYDVADPLLRELAQSTVALIATNRLRDQGNGTYAVQTRHYGQEYGLCTDEPYYSQPTAANCSGFLVGDDLVATAGHCVRNSSCAGYSFVFDFKMDGPNAAPTQVSAENVYQCGQVLAYELTRGQQDYALVKLDRPVRDRRPLTIASQTAQPGDPIMVIGHPSGLPTKITTGANVRRSLGEYFVANLDTYGGNSGSAVFNRVTHEVVGILVRGDRDYKYDGVAKCSRSNTCDDNACRGEDVTHISFIKSALSK